MNKQSFTLSAAGLKNVVMDKEEEEFIFKIGEKELKMNKFFAEFISPKVSHIHQCDPTISFLNLTEFFNSNHTKKNEILEELGSDTFLTQILNLSQGNSIEIENERLMKSIKYFSILVKNEELFNKINEIETTKKNEKKSVNELLEEIEFLYEMNPTFNGHRYSKLIDEVSIKMSQNIEKDLKEVPKCILYSIINNEHFKTEDMDSLFELINDNFLNENDDDEEEYNITRFYELIDVNKLSKTKFETFISQLDYRKLSFNLWTNICELLINKKDHKEENKIHSRKIEFDGQPNNRFNGIIRHLQGLEKKNICDRGIIDVTSSSNFTSYLPQNSVDFDKNNYFWTSDKWLKFDFKEKKIRPTHYSIKSRPDSDSCNPVNWVIEVSNTGKDDDWKVIDSRSGVTSVSKRNQSDTFDISTRLLDDEYYRYIRFRGVGLASGSNAFLAIASIEYFGYLIE